MAFVDASVPAQVSRLAIFECEFVANFKVASVVLAADVHELAFGPVHS